MLPVGSLVAGYRIERVLGSGGMGTVYLVANPELPRLDALKVLSGTLSRDEQFRSRFIREADVASRMNHPNIVAIYRRGQTEHGQLWIAMQYVDGLNADEALRQGRMTPQRAVHIVTEIGKALDYAHRHNVIHRDVKPANFLLENPPGPEERVLLGDFGIARALDDVSLTSAGSMLATVAYAAPEVVSGGNVDGRADLYSLGCTLFRMLTGQTPFHAAQGAPATIMAHISQPPPRVTDYVSWLPPAMNAVIAKSMAKDPAQRFATAAELSAAARAALQQYTDADSPTRHAVVTPRPPGQSGYPSGSPGGAPGFVGPPVKRRARRGKLAAGLAGVAVLAVVATVAALVMTRRGDDSAATDTAASTTTAMTSRKTVVAPPGPPIVAPAKLSTFLLSTAETASIMGVTDMPVSTSLQNPSDDTVGIENKDCSPALFAIQISALKGTGWVAIQARVDQNTETSPTHRVAQAVVAMPTDGDATKLFGTLGEKWAQCANTPITATYPQPPSPQYWQFGDLTKTDDMLAMTYTMEGGGGMGCQRALGVIGNLLVDVLACRIDPADKGIEVVESIEKKISA